MGEPCGMPRRLSRASVVRVLRPRSSVSFYGAVQPHLDQMQHAPINDPARYRLQKLGMGNAPEVVRDAQAEVPSRGPKTWRGEYGDVTAAAFWLGCDINRITASKGEDHG
jgi:hypothetical protein